VTKTITTSMTPSEQALIDLWDHIDRVRLKQSEQHAAIIARRALFAAMVTKETRMFDPMKVAELKRLGFTDAEIMGFQARAEATEKAADRMGVAYKAVEPEAEAGDDELTLTQADIAAIATAVAAALRGGSAAPEAELKRAPTSYPPTGLVDQKKKVFKTYNATDDAYARALGADQVGRPEVVVVVTEDVDRRPMHDKIADFAQQTVAALSADQGRKPR
jgi:hypothetical protein